MAGSSAAGRASGPAVALVELFRRQTPGYESVSQQAAPSSWAAAAPAGPQQHGSTADPHLNQKSNKQKRRSSKLVIQSASIRGRGVPGLLSGARL